MDEESTWLKKPRPKDEEGQGQDRHDPVHVPDLGRGQDPVPAPEEVTRDAPNLGAAVAPTHPKIEPRVPEPGAQGDPDLDRRRKKRTALKPRMEIAILDRVPDPDLVLETDLVLPAPRMTMTKKLLHHNNVKISFFSFSVFSV